MKGQIYYVSNCKASVRAAPLHYKRSNYTKELRLSTVRAIENVQVQHANFSEYTNLSLTPGRVIK